MRQRMIMGSLWKLNGRDELSIRPPKTGFLLGMETPRGQSGMRNADHGAHPLGLRIEFRMAEKAAYKHGDLLLSDVHIIDETVSGMA